MIINRAPARGGRGGAGRGLACSERGGRARPRGSSKLGGLLRGGGQAGFDRELPVAESSRAFRTSHPTPNPTRRSNLSAWPARLSRRASGSAPPRPGFLSPRPERRGSARGGAPPSSQLPQVLRSPREPRACE